MKNVFFPDEEVSENDLYFVHYLDTGKWGKR